jgi:hypothetical protein
MWTDPMIERVEETLITSSGYWEVKDASVADKSIR